MVSILLSVCGSSFSQSSIRSAGSFSNGSGSHAWTNLTNALTSDDNYAKNTVSLSGLFASTNTNNLIAQNFGFTIPPMATNIHIKVDVERSANLGFSVGASVSDNIVKLINSSGTITGTNNASPTNWSSGDATVSYGGNTDNWGTSWTPADINSTNFGVAISATLSAGAAAVSLTAQIDYIAVTVYYDIPLPVTLTNFKATLISDKVELNWQTDAGSQTNHFIIERSSDAKNWRRIDSVKSTGNPAAGTSYRAYDPYPNNSNYYRIKAFDMDGSSSLSPVVFVRYDLQIPPGVKVLMDLNTKTAKIQSDDNITDMKLFDLNSRQININYVSKAGSANIINTGTLPRGLYIARVQTKKTAYTTKLLIP